MRRALVVGLGAVDRGDDGIGPVVVRQVQDVLATIGPARDDVAEAGPSPVGAPSEAGDPPTVTTATPPDELPEVVVHEDPTALVQLMAERSLTVIVDALRCPGRPGSVHVLEAGRSPLPARTDPGPAGSHGFGLAGSLELARALGTLPPRVVVVGVVGGRFTVGAPLSEPVAGAVPVAAAAVLSALGRPITGSAPRDPADARSAGQWPTDATTRREASHVH